MTINNMQALIKSFLLIVILVSCGGKDSRYRDTAMLERPPTLAIDRRGDEQPIAPDDSVIVKKTEDTGLGQAVYMKESKPMQLLIKKPFDEAWRVLGLALKQGQIKVIDHEQDKGLYYVYYKEKNLFENAASLFKKEQEDGAHEANYVLNVKQDGAETKITVTPVNGAEKEGYIDNRDGYDEVSSIDEEALLWMLYETLHDDLKEE